MPSVGDSQRLKPLWGDQVLSGGANPPTGPPPPPALAPGGARRKTPEDVPSPDDAGHSHTQVADLTDLLGQVRDDLRVDSEALTSHEGFAAKLQEDPLVLGSGGCRVGHQRPLRAGSSVRIALGFARVLR